MHELQKKEIISQMYFSICTVQDSQNTRDILLLGT